MSDNQTSQRGDGLGSLVGRVSTAQAIINQLAAQILDGTLEAGAVLPEVELADRFGVSRQSLRAALAELAYRGLVRREPHRSVRVAVVTRQDAVDIYYVRDLIEGEAIRRAAADKESWPKIEPAVRHLERLPKKAAWSDIAEGDVNFHRAMVAAIGSPRLARAHALLVDEMRLILVPARHYVSQAEMVREHRDLFEVVKAGDPPAAYQRLVQHLELGTDKLLSYLPDEDPLLQRGRSARPRARC